MALRFGWFRPIVIVLFVLAAHLPGGWTQSAAADVEGNTYTSPHYKYTVTWDDTWFVSQEDSTDYDFLELTNGLTYADFAAGPDSSPNPESALGSAVAGLRSDPNVSEFVTLRDSDGKAIRHSDEHHAFAAFTFTQTFEDGSTMALAAYLETRPVTAGSVYLFFSAYMPSEDFASERPLFEQLLSSLVIPGDEGAAQGAGEQVLNGVQQVLTKGEPAPVFASGPWRVAVATSARSDAFIRIGLKPKAGKDWLVAVLDVTNWSEDDAELSAQAFTVRIKGRTQPIKIAANSTSKVASQLDLASPSDDAPAKIGAGKSTRVVLVFSLPAESQAPELILDKEALPLGDVLEAKLQPESLPKPAGPPKMTKGEIVSASDGNTLRLTLKGKDKPQQIRLLGVDSPSEDACFADEAKTLLDDLAGTAVLVETDAALKSGKPLVRYVWLSNDDGSRTLLNQRLIAEGKAQASSIPADARFGLWFETTEGVAKNGQVGLWAACETPESATQVPTSSSATSPTPRPTSTPVATPT